MSVTRTTFSQSIICSSRAVTNTISAAPLISLSCCSSGPELSLLFFFFFFSLYPCPTAAALLPNPSHELVSVRGWEARPARQQRWDRDKDPSSLRSPLRARRTSWRSTKTLIPCFGLYTFLTGFSFYFRVFNRLMDRGQISAQRLGRYPVGMADFRTATTVGARIAALRKARGFASTKALADAIPGDSVTESILQNIEAEPEERSRRRAAPQHRCRAAGLAAVHPRAARIPARAPRPAQHHPRRRRQCRWPNSTPGSPD